MKNFLFDMREFDIEKAKAGASVITRGNEPVDIIAYDNDADPFYPIIANIFRDTGKVETCFFTQAGHWSCWTESQDDLMLAN